MVDNSSLLLKGMGREVDQVVLAVQKMRNAFQATAIGGIAVMAKQIVKFTKVSGRSAASVDDQEKAIARLTITQRFLHKRLLQHTNANKLLSKTYEFLNANTDEGNKHVMRFAMGITSLIGSAMLVATIFGTVVIALGLLSIALQGADSPVLELTESFDALHYVAEGLATAFDPETGGSWVQVFAGALAVMGAVALLVSVPVGLLAGGAILAAAAFTHVSEATGSVIAGIVAAGVVVGAFVGMLMAWFGVGLGALSNIVWVINLLAGQVGIFSGVVQISVGMAIAGLALIIGGIAGLVAYAMGAGSSWKASLMAILSAVAIGLGLFVLGVAAIPAAIIAAILLVAAAVLRYRQEIWDSFLWVVQGVQNLVGDPLGWVTRQADRIKTFLLGLPTWIRDNVFQPILDNIPSLDDIPGASWVSGALGNLPGRADGGPVTGGKSYIVGERGPELFTPGSSGSITPSEQLGGGQTINMSINVSGITDRTDKRDLAREIGDLLNQELRRQGGATTRGRF